jgi:hypothetical protein
MRTNVARKQTVVAEPKPAPKPNPGGGLNFGMFKKASTGSRTSYPTVPDELGKLAESAKTVRALREQMEALEGQEKTLCFEIRNLVTAHAWQAWNGRSAVESGFQIDVPGEAPVLALLNNRYSIAKGADEKKPNLDVFKNTMRGIIGEQYDVFFKGAFQVKVNGDLIPVEKHQEFIDGLGELVAKLQVDPAAITAEPTVKAASIFHVQRHTALTAEQNGVLDQYFPMTVQIKTKHKE